MMGRQLTKVAVIHWTGLQAKGCNKIQEAVKSPTDKHRATITKEHYSKF